MARVLKSRRFAEIRINRLWREIVRETRILTSQYEARDNATTHEERAMMNAQVDMTQAKIDDLGRKIRYIERHYDVDSGRARQAAQASEMGPGTDRGPGPQG